MFIRWNFFVLLFVCSNLVIAQQPLHVLFLGNSYTYVNNLPQLISNVASSAGDSLTFSMYAPGGYTLDQHAMDANSTNLIMQGGWDYVVLQEQSQLPALQDYDNAGPDDLVSLANSYNPCGRAMFYMTWGRKNGDASFCAAWPPVCTYQGMDSLIRLRYIERATYLKTELSPVGKVWNRIRLLYPAIELYQPDESHPSEAGSYAAACCFYSALFKKDPSGIAFNYTLPANDAAIIRQVAKEVVYDSLALYDFTEHIPSALFSYSVMGNNLVLCHNSSQLAESFLWEFGDGDTSTVLNPIHTYQNDGNYTITLHAQDCDFDQIHDSIYQLQISFCSFTPTISPANALICPNYRDTFWTQSYDTYQWFDYTGDSIPGATQQYYVASQTGNYSVQVSQGGCSERSIEAYADSYIMNMTVYNIDTTQLADTVCLGDTVPFVLYPNRPAPPIYRNEWYKDGSALNLHGDTLWISSPGNYSATVTNQMCPGSFVYVSDTINVFFQNCNINVDELSAAEIQLYPQPVKDILFIKCKNTFADRYDIFDISGRMLIHGFLKNQQTEINLSDLIPGIYFFKSGNINRRIIKN